MEPLRLHIPEIDTDTDTLTAALAYATAGWYVLPVRADTKHPGSVVGKSWPSLSSRDPKTIAGWFAGTTHGIALHCGRSGAVVLDVDDYDTIPDEVALVIETSGCPYQSTRLDEPGRGHYLLANDTGRRIGNSLGKLSGATKWGEVRGANGVIIATPSVHPDGGEYRWQRTGTLPGIPDYLAEALPSSTTPETTATDAEIQKFLTTHTENTKPEALAGLVKALQAKIDSGASCHMSTLGVLTDAMAEAAAGYYDARTAQRQLWPIYLKTVTTGTSTGRILTKTEARQSYAGIVAWAIGQADAGAAKARERVAERYQDNVAHVLPEDLQPDPEPEPEPAELETIENGFWQSRDSLRLIYAASLSQMASPWAVLACCIARILTLVPPTVTLPPIIGGPGSLNWFGALVAKSGGGKGAANSVAVQLVPGDINIRGAGSGEGMVEAYERRKDPEDHVIAVLFSIDEVDSLSSMQARTGQTTMSVIRSGFSGETLGYTYRNRSSEKVPAHSYRMTMIVSVQPERAEGLFADAGGGTPQRFMWFPARDKRIKAALRDSWPKDHQGFARILPPVDLKKLQHGDLWVPEEAVALIRQAREDSMAGNDNALDGHALFCREKTAYSLALLDGRTTMTLEDWRLSGIIAAVSDWTRQRAQDTLENARQRAALERGAMRGLESYEADISRAVVHDENIRRILKWATKKLHSSEGRRMKKRDLTQAAARRDRAKLDEAMLQGVHSGLLAADGAEWALV